MFCLGPKRFTSSLHCLLAAAAPRTSKMRSQSRRAWPGSTEFRESASHSVSGPWVSGECNFRGKVLTCLTNPLWKVAGAEACRCQEAFLVRLGSNPTCSEAWGGVLAQVSKDRKWTRHLCKFELLASASALLPESCRVGFLLVNQTCLDCSSHGL